MAKGKVQCCGASLFLKRLYGVGYSFTISVDPYIPMKSAQDPIHEMVRSHVEKGQLVSAHGAELIYRLPFASSALFPGMLREIDAKKDELHIDSYGISVTTLEEVFIQVGAGISQQSTDDLNPEVIEFKKALQNRKRRQVFSTMMGDVDENENGQNALDEFKQDLGAIDEDVNRDDEKNEVPEDPRDRRESAEEQRQSIIDKRWDMLLNEISIN